MNKNLSQFALNLIYHFTVKSEFLNYGARVCSKRFKWSVFRLLRTPTIELKCGCFIALSLSLHAHHVFWIQHLMSQLQTYNLAPNTLTKCPISDTLANQLLQRNRKILFVFETMLNLSYLDSLCSYFKYLPLLMKVLLVFLHEDMLHLIPLLH